jgi:hypothetical protein
MRQRQIVGETNSKQLKTVYIAASVGELGQDSLYLTRTSTWNYHIFLGQERLPTSKEG